MPAPAAMIQILKSSPTDIPMYSPTNAVRLDRRFTTMAFFTVKPAASRIAKSPKRNKNSYV